VQGCQINAVTAAIYAVGVSAAIPWLGCIAMRILTDKKFIIVNNSEKMLLDLE